MGLLLSTRAAAERCGVTPKTVGRWVDAGILPAIFTSGGHRRIREVDLVEFLRSRRSLRARSQAPPGLRVVVLSEETAVARQLESLGRTIDPEIVVVHATTTFGAGLLVGDLRPHLVVVDLDYEPAEAVLAELSIAPQSRKAYRVVLSTDRDQRSQYADRTLFAPPHAPDILELLRDASVKAGLRDGPGS